MHCLKICPEVRESHCIYCDGRASIPRSLKAHLQSFRYCSPVVIVTALFCKANGRCTLAQWPQAKIAYAKW